MSTGGVSFLPAPVDFERFLNSSAERKTDRNESHSEELWKRKTKEGVEMTPPTMVPARLNYMPGQLGQAPLGQDP